MLLSEIVNSSPQYIHSLNITDNISHKLLVLCRHILRTNEVSDNDLLYIENTISLLEHNFIMTVIYSDPSDRSELRFYNNRLNKIKSLYKQISQR